MSRKLKAFSEEFEKMGWEKQGENTWSKRVSGAISYEDLIKIQNTDPRRMSVLKMYHNCSDIDDLYESLSQEAQHEKQRMRFELARMKTIARKNNLGILSFTQAASEAATEIEARLTLEMDIEEAA